MEIPLALEYWRGLFSFGEWSFIHRRIVLVVPLIFISIALDLVQRLGQSDTAFVRLPRPVQAALLAIAILLLLIVTQGEGEAPFIYQNF